MDNNTVQAGIESRQCFVTNKFFRNTYEEKQATIRIALTAIQDIYFDTPVSVVFDCAEVNEASITPVVCVPKLTIFAALQAFATRSGLEDTWAHEVFAVCSPSMYFKAVNNEWIPTYPGTSNYPGGNSKADLFACVEVEYYNFVESAHERRDAVAVTLAETVVTGNVALSTAFNDGVAMYNENTNSSAEGIEVFDEDAVQSEAFSIPAGGHDILEETSFAHNSSYQHESDEESYQDDNADDPDA